MTILVMGGTGMAGCHLLDRLAPEGIEIRALTRNPASAMLPAGVPPVQGDMLDVNATRAALNGVDTLFLLNAVTAEKLTQTLLTINLAREAGIQRLVYFSLFHGEAFATVPHFTAKHAAELMIEQLDIPATILQPNCFMQNDAWFKDALLEDGTYPFSVGSKGRSMMDTRHVAEVAALAMVERERSVEPLPHRIINVVGPEPPTSVSNARIWSNLLGKPLRYGAVRAEDARLRPELDGNGPAPHARPVRGRRDAGKREGRRGDDRRARSAAPFLQGLRSRDAYRLADLRTDDYRPGRHR